MVATDQTASLVLQAPGGKICWDGRLRGDPAASMTEPTVPALPAMSVSFREEDVDLMRLPEDCRDIESQAFVDALFALYQEPYEGMEGSFSCSYTELMQVRALLEEGRFEEAIPLLVQLLEREPDNLEASHVLAMVLIGHRLIS